mgnify:CR=1 FL=1
MILCAHADAGFLNESNARSRAGAHIFLSENDPFPRFNGAVLSIAQIIKFVMASAGETEAASSYLNCKAALPLRIALEEMGHPQNKKPVIVDNTSTQGLITNKMAPKRSKTYDLRVNWLKCRDAQKQFNLIWAPRPGNKGDYHTKTHPVHEYKHKRKV